MKVISQGMVDEVIVKINPDISWIEQCNELIGINKQGARQLIEVLKEWVGDGSNN